MHVFWSQSDPLVCLWPGLGAALEGSSSCLPGERGCCARAAHPWKPQHLPGGGERNTPPRVEGGQAAPRLKDTAQKT